ncbi:MAG: hypothetical protein ACK4WD_05625 [Flavobacteriales bacterium]|jgi:hypothetical protein
MITSLDPEYKDTIQIISGERTLPEISQRLIKWINKEYEVQAINVYYDKIIPDDRRRIQIIFENSEDNAKFHENGIGNYLVEKQKAISEKYIELVKQMGLKDDYPTDNVFVCFSEFSSIYRSNIYNSVPKDQLNELFEKYKNQHVWEIKVYGSGLIVFFYTNDEKNSRDYDKMIENLQTEYFSLLKPFDEFGYLNNTWVKKESKEDFDNIYEGNWFYWSRDH